ncbi:MAG: response regulator [Nitrospirota bacterium]|nr:response regulator [Nitrospirota bacterium]
MAGPLSLESAVSQPASRAPWQRGGSVLVVDDEVSIQGLLVELLRSEGYSVRAVGSAQEALTALKSAPASLLITDIKLPDQDGIGLLQQACALDRHMIGAVMTGYATIDLAVQAMKAGAAEFLMKPFQIDVVLLTVKRLMELYRLRIENAVLKKAVVLAGGVHLQHLALTDFGTGHQFLGTSGPSDYDRGITEGEQRAGERKAVVQRQEQALFADAVCRLDGVWKSFSQTMEADVTALAFSLATRILRDTVAERKDAVTALLKSALATIRESCVVTVRTHPSDVAILEAARVGLSRDREGGLTLHIEGDASLSPGSCVVQSTNRLVDASLDQQLLRLGEVLQNRGRREPR